MEAQSQSTSTPRSIVEVGESGNQESMPVYNRRAERRIERRLKQLARKSRRRVWRFPGA